MKLSRFQQKTQNAFEGTCSLERKERKKKSAQTDLLAILTSRTLSSYQWLLYDSGRLRCFSEFRDVQNVRRKVLLLLLEIVFISSLPFPRGVVLNGKCEIFAIDVVLLLLFEEKKILTKRKKRVKTRKRTLWFLLSRLSFLSSDLIGAVVKK